MPFKSKAQMAKFGMMVKSGEISKATYNEFKSATKSIKKLPMHAPKPAKKK